MWSGSPASSLDLAVCPAPHNIQFSAEIATIVSKFGACLAFVPENPTKEMRDQWQKDAQERYGLTPEQLHEVDVKLQEAASEVTAVRLQ